MTKPDTTLSKQAWACVIGWYGRAMPIIRITVDGRLALTIEQAAQQWGIKPDSIAGELSRHRDAIEVADMLDGRKPLYFAADIDRMMRARPGRGAPGRPRRRAGRSTTGDDT